MKKTIITCSTAILLIAISCTKESLNTSPSANAQTQADDATQAAHYIGEPFGGGIVFYINNNGKHGLIASNADLRQLTWWNGTFITTGATGTVIGTGKANTKTIVLAQGKPGPYAALACSKYKRNGFTDWYLPSKDELNELYKQKNVVGVFVNGYYWSSSQGSSNLAWEQDFYSGSQSDSATNHPDNVRAIRSF